LRRAGFAFFRAGTGGSFRSCGFHGHSVWAMLTGFVRAAS
jgi:hypothetical protein